jgi:hypothetical protein
MASFSFSDLDDCALAHELDNANVLQELAEADFEGPGVLLETYVTALSWNVQHFRPDSSSALAARFNQMSDTSLPLSALSKQTDVVFASLSDVSADDLGAFIFALGIAAQNIMRTAGIPDEAAKAIAGAMGELIDNIRDHSGKPRTGLIGAGSIRNSFEFVAADRGRGALAGYRENPEFAELRDEGDALTLAVIDHVSRRGRNSGGGTGFRTLIRALASLDASVRVRSGNQALLLDGTAANRTYTLAQKARLQGFVVSARVTLPNASL